MDYEFGTWMVSDLNRFRYYNDSMSIVGERPTRNQSQTLFVERTNPAGIGPAHRFGFAFVFDDKLVSDRIIIPLVTDVQADDRTGLDIDQVSKDLTFNVVVT